MSCGTRVSGSFLFRSIANILFSTVTRDISSIPHTETSASPERRFAVSFLEAQEITLEDVNRSEGFYDFPVYQFQDEPGKSPPARKMLRLICWLDFRSFQETIYGMRLLLLRDIHLVTSNREQESSRQDLRLWSSDDNQEVVILMFYTNSRTAYLPKEYYTEQGKRCL